MCLIAIASVAGGCGTQSPIYDKEGITLRQMQQDEAECASRSIVINGKVAQDCMKNKGYIIIGWR